MRRLFRIARTDPSVTWILRVHQLRERAKELYPGNELLQERWVQARIRLRMLGCRRPRVAISCRYGMEALQ